MLAVVTVIVEVPEPDTDAGLNDALAPAGSPVTLKATLPVNPFTPVTVAVYGVLPPCVTASEDGLTPTEKSELVP